MITDFFAKLTIEQLGWFSIITYILHYAEEGPRLVQWFKDHHPIKGFSYTQRKLNVENLILFSITFFTVLFANIFPNTEILNVFILSSGIGFIGNTFFHVVPTLRTGIYSPGVVTASGLNPVLLYLLISKAYENNLLSPQNIIISVVFGIVILPAVVIFTHKVLFRD